MLTGSSFFPHLISVPFSQGLDTAFGFAIVACLVAAAASMLRGGRYRHGEETAAQSGAEVKISKLKEHMRVEWYGQSAFRLSAEQGTVFIDPFADMSGLASRGINFEYPPIEADDVDLLLVTHEHGDHNGVEAIAGDPAVLRATAGTHESPLGEVIGIASEHDQAAGTQRGPNTIFVFELEGLRVAHLGDFGQAGLRAEQAAAIGEIDLLFVPVGGGPTIGAAGAAALDRGTGPTLGGADALPHPADRLSRDRG